MGDPGLIIFGDHGPKTIAQLEDVASRAERAALMADGHLGYVMPIGGVAVYREKGSVVGVGFDIACGSAAIRTDLKYVTCSAHRTLRTSHIARYAHRTSHVTHVAHRTLRTSHMARHARRT